MTATVSLYEIIRGSFQKRTCLPRTAQTYSRLVGNTMTSWARGFSTPPRRTKNLTWLPKKILLDIASNPDNQSLVSTLIPRTEITPWSHSDLWMVLNRYHSCNLIDSILSHLSFNKTKNLSLIIHVNWTWEATLKQVVLVNATVISSGDTCSEFEKI